MLAFSRITSVLFFVLSLSFFAYAAPTPAYNSNEVAPSYEKGRKALDLVIQLELDIQTTINTIGNVHSIAEASERINAIVSHVETCTNAIAALGIKIDVNPSLEADIAVKVAAVLTLIVNLCISLVVKFGVQVCFAILAKIDVCLQLLLITLNVCVEGVVGLVANLIAKIGVTVLARVHLGLCINVLGL